MKGILILILCLLTIVHHTSYAEQQETLSAHTLQLNYRQAQDVMPLIRPFLHPQGIMTGEAYRILITTSDKNYRDLLQFVAEIDVSQRQLRISVSLDSARAKRENQFIDTGAAETSENKILQNSTIRQYATGRRDKSPLTQQIQVIEGKWARISTGESVPIGQRTRNPDGTTTETIHYKSVNHGFQILPRISGEQVSLFIRPQLDSQQAKGAGRIRIHSVETTIKGKLNQWILISDTNQAVVEQAGTRNYSTQERNKTPNQIFVKVELIQ